HPVRKGWRHHAMEDGAGQKPRPLHAELPEPPPPGLEALEVLDGRPDLLGWDREAEPPRILDHTGRAHPSTSAVVAGQLGGVDPTDVAGVLVEPLAPPRPPPRRPLGGAKPRHQAPQLLDGQ